MSEQTAHSVWTQTPSRKLLEADESFFKRENSVPYCYISLEPSSHQSVNKPKTKNQKKNQKEKCPPCTLSLLESDIASKFSCNTIVDSVVIEFDQIAHDLFSKIPLTACSMRIYQTKVNAVLFELLIIPHLLRSGGELSPRKKSAPVFLIQFYETKTFEQIFSGLASKGFFNPMTKKFKNGQKMWIVAHKKYPVIWRFSANLGTLAVHFFVQEWTKGGLPINDLYISN